ncbi:uncharacterized protein EV422DRAFT_554245 [Fimicolochytrium jonesii]|uniref:uncharacterized protein n=1 Tax=Fimicolochytrium jonesii TaxID=1396493 RepID=UPI0022FE90CA|nr:uncharacterized protein EV422DRAFT_554245 [Fimicolochytrium jonesii]KAI8824092.1 hypothetical protein EV422DRAFT_554245 [Fimicolochytrium jonesii]
MSPNMNSSPRPLRNPTRALNATPASKCKNIFSGGVGKSLYTNINLDTTATAKLKCNDIFFAVPWGIGNIGVFPVRRPPFTDPIRLEVNPPLILPHGKQIQDFEFSSVDPTILATCTRADGLVRIWKIPTDVSQQGVGREIDAADTYLAGHEKKVELLKFHPTVGNILATCSADSTIRLWDLVRMQDRVSLVCPAQSAQHISFDFCGGMVAVMGSDANLYLYDCRAGPEPIQTAITGHNPSKSCRVSWLTPDPLIVTTGFEKGNARTVNLWDTSNLSSPIQSLNVDGTGVGHLQPYWDPGLPILYCGSKAEGIRAYELLHGTLAYIGAMKLEKQATAVELMPKSLCDARRCEIARFLSLSVENSSVDMTTIHVPRVHGEEAFQEDLYPPIPMAHSGRDADLFFNTRDTIEPLMVHAVLDTVSGTKKREESNEPLAHLLRDSLAPPSVEELLHRHGDTMLRKSTTLRRPMTVSANGSSRSVSNASINSFTQSRATETIPASHAPSPATSLDGRLDIERKTWLTATWEPHYLSLKKLRLYFSSDADADTPLYSISMSAIKRVEGFSIGIDRGDESDKVGIFLETTEKTHRLRAGSKYERDRWLDALTEGMQRGLSLAHQGLRGSTLDLPVLPRASSANLLSRTPSLAPLERKPSSQSFIIGNRLGAALLGDLLCLTATENTKQIWNPRLVMLDEDGLLHLFVNDIKSYTQGKPPVQTWSLHKAMAVRLVDLKSTTSMHETNGSDTSGMKAFQITTLKHNVFFEARNPVEAANWVTQIRRVINVKNFLPAAELIESDVLEGFVSIKDSDNGLKLPPGRYWLQVVDGNFLYSALRLSTSPFKVVDSGKFDGVQIGRAESNPDTAAQGKFIPAKDLNLFTLSFTTDIKCVHEVESLVEANVWARELTKVRMVAYDVLQAMGISSEETFQDEMFQAEIDESRGNWKAEMERITILDEKSIEKGEQKFLAGVFGKVRLTIGSVPCTWQSLRSDGAFVLDLGSVVYHWNGVSSSRVCRARAMDLASRIRKMRANRPRVLLVDDTDRDLLNTFFKALGSEKATDAVRTQQPLSSPSDPVLDANVKMFISRPSRLRKNRLRLVYEGTAPSRKLLVSDTVCLVLSRHQVFAWIGNSCPRESSDRALANLAAKRGAMMLRDALGSREHQVFVRREFEGRESAIWKETFVDYEGSLPISMRIETETKGNIAPQLAQPKIDLDTLPRRASLPAHLLTCPDDGKSGRRSVHRVEDFLCHDVPAHLVGQFFQGESYIIPYMYKPPNSGVEKCISYFWQGSTSSVTQKGTSALLTIELSKQTDGDVTQIRVVEGKEPLHLCKLFSDGIVVRIGRQRRDGEILGLPVGFDIRECYEGCFKATEVAMQDLPFNSNHITLVIFDKMAYIWTGAHSVLGEQQYAATVARKFLAEESAVHIVRETEKLPKEIAGLFESYGAKLPSFRSTKARYLPRLFACSAGSGVVQVEEVPMFVQDDLDAKMVMILDGFSSIYVWFGSSSRSSEKIIGMQTAIEYGSKASEAPALFVTYEHQEPHEFSRAFPGWARSKRKSLYAENQVLSRPLKEVLEEYTRETYPVEILLGDNVPPHLDPTRLEAYMTEEDFEALFKMTKQAYWELQPWKRVEVKKALGVF